MLLLTLKLLVVLSFYFCDANINIFSFCNPFEKRMFRNNYYIIKKMGLLPLQSQTNA